MAELRQLILAIIFVVIVIPFGQTRAAEIRASTSPSCVVSISGELVQGDYERFLAISKPLFPGNDGESTHRDTVCLDSPGGNLVEGVKFANHFYKNGVGTVVDADAECHSACAIMFMLGTAQGDEVAFINRKLHAKGVLGFHRPFLSIEERALVDVSALSIAFDSAFQSALDLIAIANNKSPWTNTPMMKADLMQQMLAHVGNDMFLIDSVDRVERYEIELIGYDVPDEFTAESAFYACENALQWPSGLTSEDITYAKSVQSDGQYRRVRSIETKNGEIAFEVSGLADGYAREGCIIFKEGAVVKGCGIDEYTNVQLGEGDCDTSNYREKAASLRPLAALHPWTKIRSLAATDAKPQLTLSPFRCFVRKAELTIDNEPCEMISGKTSQGREMMQFLWPSGGKTVLVLQSNGPEINGVPTSKVDVPGIGQCYPNSQTGNEFCFLSQ